MIYVEVEFYCGINDYLDKLYLDFNDDAFDEDVKKKIREYYDIFVKDMINECYEDDEEDVIISCQGMWKFAKKDEDDDDEDWSFDF
jgi:hypothetical protein